MRLLTIAAAAAVAAGIYHWQRYQRRRTAAEPSISDALLAERVRVGVAGAASSPIDVRVSNGIVTLRGTVKKAERDLAIAAALAVPGVTEVVNQFEAEGEAAGMERSSLRAGMTQRDPGAAI